MKKMISNVLLIVCVIVFCFSLYQLVGYLTEYKKGESEYSKIAEVAIQTDALEADEKAKEKKENPPEVNFSELKKRNSETVGWIVIENTVINYPIVQTINNETYLNYTFEKRKNHAGAIFLDSQNNSDFSSDHSILYGHNLKTGKMFGSLKFYEDKEYWKDHPYIWILTEQKSLKYEIFACRTVKQDDDLYTTNFESRTQMEQSLKQWAADSYYDTGITAGPDDYILTLSTCISDSEENRRVIQAKLIYEEEN